jgi:Skp family chaperone for outer membrane proteins
VVADLATQAEKVASLSAGSCAARDASARLQSDVISAIPKIPQRYREELLGAANDLADRLATCVERDAGDEDDDRGKREKREKKRKREKDR